MQKYLFTLILCLLTSFCFSQFDITSTAIHLKNGKVLKGFGVIVGGESSDTNNRKIRFKKKKGDKRSTVYDHTDFDFAIFQRKDKKGKLEWEEKYVYIAENESRILLVREFSEEELTGGKLKIYLLDFRKMGPMFIDMRAVVKTKKRHFLLQREGEKYATRIFSVAGKNSRNQLTEYFSDCYEFAKGIRDKKFEARRVIDIFEIATQYNTIANDCK